jgi:hypothetical protein
VPGAFANPMPGSKLQFAFELRTFSARHRAFFALIRIFFPEIPLSCTQFSPCSHEHDSCSNGHADELNWTLFPCKSRHPISRFPLDPQVPVS